MSPTGLITYPSSYDPVRTADRLVSVVTERGMTVLARIDHAQAAAGVGLDLRPTQVLIFGNPKAGTPLMQAVQTTGIDLPLKALVWQDEAGKTWLSYNDPSWLAERHGLPGEVGEVVVAMADTLAVCARLASGADTAETASSAGLTPERKHQEELLDEALEESFPASDPPAIA
jgi:uncharacterized protein (DUF302 family)